MGLLPQLVSRELALVNTGTWWSVVNGHMKSAYQEAERTILVASSTISAASVSMRSRRCNCISSCCRVHPDIRVKVDVEEHFECDQSQPWTPLSPVLGPHLGLAGFPTMDTFERRPTCNCSQYTSRIYKANNQFEHPQ